MKIFPLSESIIDAVLHRFLRKEVAKDDILDSLAATVVACSPVSSLISVPESNGKDAEGLPIEIKGRVVYCNKISPEMFHVGISFIGDNSQAAHP